MRQYITFFIFCFAFIANSSAEQSSFDKHRLQRLDNKLEQYVDDGRYPGFTALIYHNNKLAHEITTGWQDRERKIPLQADTIFRIYSMSKAITSAAAMILFEEGHFQLDDPIDTYLPEFKDLRVYVSGEANSIKTEALQRPITFRDLFIHTAGFTYHFLGDDPVQKLYRKKGILPGVETLYASNEDATPVSDLASMVSALASIPLLHQPGERMTYSISLDVLARLIEIISGEQFDVFLERRLFTPLGMSDTGFVVPEHKLNRFAANYAWVDGQLILLDAPNSSRFQNTGRLLSGGAGLVSTRHDYMQFLLMMLNKGKWNDVRILGAQTVEFMLSNHFPKTDMPRPQWMRQQGHGLGFALTLDPARAGMMTPVGTADWAGAASTFFWIDRKENVAAVFMTQDMPITNDNLIREGRSLTYQALTR